MRIYLIGYMGSGKSTVGKGLAKNLELDFIDMDVFIENSQHKTIPQIFELYGEQGFRQIEQKALRELSEFENVIIATGGGAPCFFDNMQLINQTGTSIYLKATASLLAQRLMNSKIERPLIKGKNYEQLVGFIDETLNAREKFYMQAKCILPFDRDLSDDEVLDAFNKHMR